MVTREVLNQSISADERASNPAQKLFDNTVAIASVLKKGVTLTVNSKGEARYDFVPNEAKKMDPSSPTAAVTIFEASTKLPSSVETTNGQKKPKKEHATKVNEVLAAKNRRREQNEAMFSGIRGKNVYANGQRVNVEAGPVKPENNRTQRKRNSRGRRNGSR